MFIFLVFLGVEIACSLGHEDCMKAFAYCFHVAESVLAEPGIFRSGFTLVLVMFLYPFCH